ncbi:Death domain-containing protein CRADD [Orchesella cincta]|uniref:Death domain-containing protein CRADD n=1 Tax=Orchesella cincta TaxID=48709 RepID=A0A1D2ND32_ORCCI|nr:Death domain-containing protein CRADD [Orchesella cincta]
MIRRDRDKLISHRMSLLDVTYYEISPHLIQRFVLTTEMHEDIESMRTSRMKMEKLLSILPTRGENAMREFITALRPSYGWIARQLEADDSGRRNPSQVQNDLNLGNLEDVSIANHIRDITQIFKRNMQVVSSWNMLAYTMNISRTTIADIKREMSYSGGHEWAIFTMLEAWVDQTGNSRATFTKLVELLRREGMNNCAEEVIEYWSSSVESLNIPFQNVHQPRNLGRGNHAPPVITDV